MKSAKDFSWNIEEEKSPNVATASSVALAIGNEPQELPIDPSIEWLEPDGLGGFASGTAALMRTRRYHALLLAAVQPPASRIVIVNGLEAWVDTPSGRFALSTQHYTPDVEHPEGVRHVSAFTARPWPCWEFRLDDGTLIECELFVPSMHQAVALRWWMVGASVPATLHVRLLLSGRDYHSLHHENPQFNFEPQELDGQVLWRPYAGIPGVAASHNGRYIHEPVWYRSFLYKEEELRGLDCCEDLASPGTLQWDLNEAPAVLLLEATHTAVQSQSRDLDIARETASATVLTRYDRWRRKELRRRDGFASQLELAADAYLIQGCQRRTIVAGYPWFTDWGRDTFIAVRGLCLATDRLDQARDILLGWAGLVSQGMLPNRFPDQGESPEYNSVDASLWFIVAVHDYFMSREEAYENIPYDEQAKLEKAVDEILNGYAAGTRYGIRLDSDGLLAAGEPGVQLTWMDAKIGDWVVTPRSGKPVEVQALWLNALWIAGRWTDRWRETLSRGRRNFARRFISDSGSLHDVVDVDHVPGTFDSTLRPNQIFAVGGLPMPLIEGESARRVVAIVEEQLWTPMGLRTLAPSHPDYCPRYIGDARERDSAYHQGTVWPWLSGPFVEAWVRVHGGTSEAKRRARERFLSPLLAHVDEAGCGHISEIADGDEPHTPRGCPFQAWSLGEVLRLSNMVLTDPIRDRKRKAVRSGAARSVTPLDFYRPQPGTGR